MYIIIYIYHYIYIYIYIWTDRYTDIQIDIYIRGRYIKLCSKRKITNKWKISRQSTNMFGHKVNNDRGLHISFVVRVILINQFKLVGCTILWLSTGPTSFFISAWHFECLKQLRRAVILRWLWRPLWTIAYDHHCLVSKDLGGMFWK